MKGFFEGIFNNKNTTLAGIGLIVAGIGKFLQDKDFSSLTITLVSGIGMLLAKDGNNLK